MATRKEYDYDSSPLPKDERTFRLIQLLKHADGNVLYDLVPFQLANAPDYEAISYRWGSPELSHSITIGNASLRVTSSVYDIMNDSCLHPQETGETRYLWIDFVCINQNDKTEKDKQIPLMRDIYAGAAKVVIYLGDAPDALLACQFIPHLLQYAEDKIGNREATELAEIRSPSVNPLSNRERFDAFLRMITHDYWSRTWIIQEIICGKQVSILYGGSYLDWKSVVLAVFFIGGEKNLLNMLSDALDKARSTVVQRAFNCILNVWFIQKAISSETHLSLADILLLTGHSQAKLPQDKVIALLGLSSDADHPDLQPNHKLTVGQVYQQATSHSLRQGCFILLNIAGLANRQLDGSTIPGLPSWVPDFSSSGLWLKLDNPKWPYRSGGSSAEADVVIDDTFDAKRPNTFGVKGMIIGRIAVMSTLHAQPSHWIESPESSLRDKRPPTVCLSPSVAEDLIHYVDHALRPGSDLHHEVWEMVEAHCPDPYLLPTGVSVGRDEALWRTMVWNMDLDLERETAYPAPEEMGREYQVFQTLCKAQRTGDFASTVKSLWTPENLRHWNGFHHITSQLRTASYPCVVTDRGHMGAVLPGAEIGDLVCVFRGANVPYILRRVKDDDQGTMQLVCPAYIHGFMDGEAIESGKYEETWFQIV